MPPDLLRKWNITIVPHALIIDGRTYRDSVDIKPGEFYRLLRQHRAAFTTAAPTPQQFLDAFLAAKVRGLLPKVNLLAFLDTLYYLSRGGRVGRIKAWTGTLLGTKPLAKLSQSEARLLSRPRSRHLALDRLVNIMRERVGSGPVSVNVREADANEEAQALVERIGREFDRRQSLASQFTPVMGAHTGPGPVGVAFHLDDGEWDETSSW